MSESAPYDLQPLDFPYPADGVAGGTSPSLNENYEPQNLTRMPPGPLPLTPFRRNPTILAQEKLPTPDTIDTTSPGLDQVHSIGSCSPSPIPQKSTNASPTAFNHTSLRQSLDNGKYLFLASLFLLSCVAAAGWILASGPKFVPRQDTRITNAIISTFSKLALAAAVWILTQLLRIQWTRLLISGRSIKLRALLLVCGNMGTLDRIRYLHLMPTPQIRITILVGLGVTVCMTLTSAAFKYVVIPSSGIRPFLGPDFQTLCNYSNINGSTYFCIDTNKPNLDIQWNYLDVVNSGAGGNVMKSGNTTSGQLSANITFTSAAAEIRLPSNPPAPWAAVDVSCTSVDLNLTKNGTGALATTIVVVDGLVVDELSISNMPTWTSQVQLYQKANDAGPWSHLMSIHVVLLGRDMNDGSSNTKGLSGSAVRSLGYFDLDLRGYGATLQPVLGAAAYCTFSGSAGGDWPDITWPVWNTTNVVVGPGPEKGAYPMSTVFLNYGPGWQYSPINDNSIPGFTVSYIANFTTDAPTFPSFIAAYIRNQWALTMYTSNFVAPYVKNTSYNVITEPSIHIQATAILAVPLASLVLCIGCAVSGVWMMRHLGDWYKRVENAPWWLLKAVDATPGLGELEVNEDEFAQWAERRRCWYEVDSWDADRKAVLKLQ